MASAPWAGAQSVGTWCRKGPGHPAGQRPPGPGVPACTSCQPSQTHARPSPHPGRAGRRPPCWQRCHRSLCDKGHVLTPPGPRWREFPEQRGVSL